MRNINNIKGITLIELLIVVVIIGVLSAVAVPAYNEYILESNRTDAYNALDKMAKAQVQYSIDNNGVFAAQANIAAVGGANTERGYYTLAITNPSGVVTSFTITATAVTTGPQNNDTGCTVMTINHALQRTPIACW